MYFGHSSNIKCIRFESYHYTINLNVVLFFMVFSGFDSIFLSMSCELESMKLFFSKTKIIIHINLNKQINKRVIRVVPCYPFIN